MTAGSGDGRERAVCQRIVEAYERILPDTPDEWGRLDELADHSTRETLQHLDAEERREGQEITPEVREILRRITTGDLADELADALDEASDDDPLLSGRPDPDHED